MVELSGAYVVWISYFGFSPNVWFHSCLLSCHGTEMPLPRSHYRCNTSPAFFDSHIHLAEIRVPVPRNRDTPPGGTPPPMKHAGMARNLRVPIVIPKVPVGVCVQNGLLERSIPALKTPVGKAHGVGFRFVASCIPWDSRQKGYETLSTGETRSVLRTS